MAQKVLQAKLKVRSDTATNWQSNNPVLLQGEPALETDTNKLKFGDGTSTYNDLSYISSDAVTVEANPTEEATQTLEKLRVGNDVYSVPQGTEVIDLGTVTIADNTGTVNITSEQMTSFLSDSPPSIKFTTSDGITFSLSRTAVSGGQMAIFAGIVVADGTTMAIDLFAKGTSGTVTMTELAQAADVGGGGGVEVVDLGTITMSNAQGSVTLTSEQFAKLTTSPYPQAKMVLSELDLAEGQTLQLVDVSLNFVMQINMSGSEQAFYSGVLIIPGSTGVADAIINILFTPTQLAGSSQYLGSVVITNNNMSGTDVEIPTGGLAGQVLTKQSATDYDVAWTTVNAAEPTVITEQAYTEALAAGTIEDDKLYYIQGTSDSTLNVSQTAQATTYDNTTSGLTATTVQAAIDEVKADIPANADFTLAGLSEKSYNNLTDKPTIPTVDLSSIATALGLTTTQLNNLITFAKSITSANTSGTTVNNEFTAQSFDTTA